MPDWNRLFMGEKIDQPRLLSPLVLAYIGDAVYELLVRSRVVARGFARTGEIHSQSVRYVRADAQARALKAVEGMLTGEEAEIARRGRNAKSPHSPRGTRMTAYRHSTGLECLVGYLYLKGNPDRLAEIMERVFEMVENE
jgi:ribonuclease-3 family protein